MQLRVPCNYDCRLVAFLTPFGDLLVAKLLCSFSPYFHFVLWIRNKEFIDRRLEITYGCKSVRGKRDYEGNRQSF